MSTAPAVLVDDLVVRFGEVAAGARRAVGSVPFARRAMASAPAQPPTPDRPHWRDGQGRRTTVLAVLASHAPAAREQLLEEHAAAVCRIVRAAAAARLNGDQARARTLAAQASRLCGELAGLWPAGSDEPLR